MNGDIHAVADDESPAADSNANTQDLAKDAPKKSSSEKSPTVQRILDLLNEMESTSQVDHCGLQKFHPCPLCSGKLITVWNNNSHVL